MSSRSRSKSGRLHNPLAEDLVATGNLRVKSNKRKAKTEDDEDRFVDSRSSRKILKIGQELIDEDQKENAPIAPNRAFTFESRLDAGTQSEEDAAVEDGDEWGDEEEEMIEEVVHCGSKLREDHRILTGATGRK